MRLIVIIIFLLLPVFLFAQNANIQGYIYATDSITPLQSASITLEGTKQGSASNGKGFYNIKNIPAGEYTIIASNIGFLTLEQDITIKPGETYNLNIYMIESVLDLPEVLIQSLTITGGQTRIKEIPGSAYFISPKQIERYSYTDVSRTLRMVPGVNLQEEDGFGLRPNIGLRGTGVERSSKITVMEDGVLMAPAPYSAPAAYYFPTIGRMQSIEILKGSSQVKYGPYTTGGAINLISTQIPNEFAGRIHLLGGSFGNLNLHAYVGNSHERVGYMVETFIYQSNGFKDLDDGGETGFDKKDFLGKFRFNTKADKKIYQAINFKFGQSFETSNETYLGLTANDFEETPFRRYAGSQKDLMETDQRQYVINYSIRFPKILDINTTLYRTEFSRNWYKLDKVIDSSGTSLGIAGLLNDPDASPNAMGIVNGTINSSSDALWVKANNRDYYSMGVQTIFALNYISGPLEHSTDIGIRYHYDQIDRFQWVDGYQIQDGVMSLTTAGTPGTESNRVEDACAFASYIQHRMRYDRFSVTAGLRFEHISLSRMDYGKSDPERLGVDLTERQNTVSVWIPGLGLDYKFNPHVSIFAGVHKGFAPPGNTDGTQPENSINYEMGVRYAKDGLSWQAVGFMNDYSNLLGADLAAAGGAGTTELFNGGEARSYGLELQLGYDLLSSLETGKLSLPLSLVYTFTDAEFTNNFESEFGAWGEVSEGDKLPYLANHTGSFMLSLEHLKFSLSLTGNYSSAMRTVAGSGEIQDNEIIEGRFLLDASATYHLMDYVSVFGSVSNIADKVYAVSLRPAGYRPGLPRTFMFGLKADF